MKKDSTADFCQTCKAEIDDSTNYNGWCKHCFDLEMNKYRKMCSEQDGLAGLTDAELEMIY